MSSNDTYRSHLNPSGTSSQWHRSGLLAKKNAGDILNFLYDREGEMQKFIIQWANQVTTGILQVEMSHLASKETSFHF